MKTTLTLLLALSLPLGAFAQGVNADTEKAVTKMEQDFSAALIKGDTVTLEGMLADDCYTVTPDGSTATKAAFLADVKSGDLKFEQNKLEEIKVRVADADIAVVTYQSTDKGTYKGKDISGKFRWTDVVVRRGGKWLFVVGQGTPMGDSKP